MGSPDAGGAMDDGYRRGRDIVVLGGSAGGQEAVTIILRSLPTDFAAALFIVLHRERDLRRNDCLVV